MDSNIIYGFGSDSDRSEYNKNWIQILKIESVYDKSESEYRIKISDRIRILIKSDPIRLCGTLCSAAGTDDLEGMLLLFETYEGLSLTIMEELLW